MGMTYFFISLLTTGVFSFVFTYFLYNPNRLPFQHTDTSNKCGLAVIGAISIGWTLLEIFPQTNAWSSIFSSFGIFPFLIAAIGLSLFSIEKGPLNRFWVYLFITLISVQFLPHTILVFQGLLPIELDRLSSSIIWAIFIHLYTTLDKLENIPLIQTQALCIGLTFLFPIYPLVFSSAISVYPFLILIAILGFLFYKKYFPYLRLGKTGAAPLGFLMGLFFILLAGHGMWLAFFIMPSYLYFEWVYSSIYRLTHRSHQLPIKYTFYLSHVVQKHLNGIGILPFLFKRMIFISLLGILIKNHVIFALIALFILFADLINRLNTWGTPKPRIRDTFSDIKKVSITLWDSAKKELSNLKKR